MLPFFIYYQLIHKLFFIDNLNYDSFIIAWMFRFTELIKFIIQLLNNRPGEWNIMQFLYSILVLLVDSWSSVALFIHQSLWSILLFIVHRRWFVVNISACHINVGWCLNFNPVFIKYCSDELTIKLCIWQFTVRR